MEKIFIIGRTHPLQGEEYNQAYQQFAEWESKLKEMGFEVVNPMKLFSKHTTIIQARKNMIMGLSECNAIILLDDWKEDDWARHLFLNACQVKCGIYTERDHNHLMLMAETLKAAMPKY